MDGALNILDLILYRDALILVVDKPAGMAVHIGRGPSENLESYFEGLRFGLPNSPALAHRLDKDTSGCLVLGRNRFALKTLADLFAKNTVDKAYQAIVHGNIEVQDGVIDLPMANITGKKYHWRMKVDPKGKPAKTEFRVIQRLKDATLVELKPITGRTHQLRVHAAAMGWPIVGDSIYGSDERDQIIGNTGGMQLHAHKISIPLYPNKAPVEVVSHLPERMMQMLKTQS
jgi:tRNA pseudouridine32 synthase/23S rRNA pseudouridine746 synthase